MTPTPNLCLSCQKPVKGRVDKKFCDDYCRNNYNNSLKGTSNNTIRNINNGLRKNRRILEELLGEEEGMKKMHLDKLNQKGFIFKYFTHQYTNQKGNIYHFCYEFGYLPLDNGWYLIVKRNEE
jgi:hypothetical protein